MKKLFDSSSSKTASSNEVEPSSLGDAGVKMDTATSNVSAIPDATQRHAQQFNVEEELAKSCQRRPVLNQRLRENRIFIEGSDKEAQIAISAYKNLRTRVMLRLAELNTNSVMVAGTAQNVGKTLTSINLALALARRSNSQVVLVDMDLRSPSLHHLFGFEPTANIVDVAEGRASLSEALVDPKIKNLRILPGTTRMEDSSEAIVSEQMLALYSEFEVQENTMFVYDTPPVLGCDDVAAVAPYMKACLFVVSERATSRKELASALQMMGDSCEILGVTINRSHEGNFSSYYY